VIPEEKQNSDNDTLHLLHWSGQW